MKGLVGSFAVAVVPTAILSRLKIDSPLPLHSSQRKGMSPSAILIPMKEKHAYQKKSIRQLICFFQ